MKNGNKGLVWKWSEQTDGGRKILEIIRSESEKQRAFSNSRITNHEKLEQVIEFSVSRRRGRNIHLERCK